MASARSTREQIGVDLPDPPEIEIEEQPVAEEESSRPEWLPEKFKDESEFVNSYKTLEDELRRRGEDQRRMEAQLSQMQEMLEEDREARQQAPPGDPQAVREQLLASYEQDPIGTMAYLAQQYAQQTVEARLAAIQAEQTPLARQQSEQQNQLMAMTVDRALTDTYEDWPQYKERVVEEIQRDPTLLNPDLLTSPEQTMRQLTRIYENVKARDILSQAQNGNFVENQLGQMKRQAQTISGQGARPPESSADDEHFARILAAAKGMSYSSYMGG